MNFMAKFDGIRGQELLEVEDKSEKEDQITLIFKDNRFLFIKLENGKMVAEINTRVGKCYKFLEYGNDLT